MIVGTGIDIVEMNRIKDVMARQKSFTTRILTNKEQQYFEALSANRQIEFLAGRFAAKEAFAKAFGTGIGKELSWQDMEIIPNETGKPVFISKKYSGTIHLSISHSKEYAVANVILEKM